MNQAISRCSLTRTDLGNAVASSPQRVPAGLGDSPADVYGFGSDGAISRWDSAAATAGLLRSLDKAAIATMRLITTGEGKCRRTNRNVLHREPHRGGGFADA